ncbi:fumarylacetoacetate hydrolase family protein [Afifella pfennigii]|uniref:fumarylacetoacetate hydrolase family protein n=1 Tax=Afifella pfennigii TaxID=209897 RepID=UPI00047DEEBE|nr:fumarylacetoacetate hydrolase family protein [Afifella pfennigii]
MKLSRVGEEGNEKPALIDAEGKVRDLSGEVEDFFPHLMTLELRERLARLDPSSLPVIDNPGRFGPPIARPGHFIAVGLNYADHAREAGVEPPVEPVLFSKAPSSVCGPDDDVIIPVGSQKTDWEVELAFLIGRRAFRVDEAEALHHVFGYMVCNDVSERAWQLEGTGQWIKGKSAPHFSPLGPVLVTSEEVGDPQSLGLWLDVNGKRMQTGSTSTMIFPVAELISYISQLMVLEPGDIVTTGTPPGVGMGMRPQVYLKPGDEIRLGIDKLGEQRQKVVAATA